MLTEGKDLPAVLQALEVSETALHRWWNRARTLRVSPAGVNSEEAKRLKLLKEEPPQLKLLVADQPLDIQMLKHVASGNPRGGPVGASVNSSTRGLLLFPAEHWGAVPALRERVRR